MSKIHFTIPIPTFIENSILYFLLRYRKKHHGYPFRRIKLIQVNCRAKPVYAVVDPDDFKKLSQYNWQLLERKSNCYAAVFYEGKILYMHRFITNAPKGLFVDHRNRNSLDNRKANLRFATHSQNCCNRKPSIKNASSKYRGVRKRKDNGRYRADIGYKGKTILLGNFDNEDDAARAYDEAAKKYHGEFAVLNFPQEATEPLAKTDGGFYLPKEQI